MSGNTQASTFHVSTDALPERDRLAFWREQFGRNVARYDFEPLESSRIYGRVTARATPGFQLISIDHSAMRVLRTPELLTDGNDDLVLQITMTGNICAQLGREIKVDPGDAVLCSNADAGTFVSPSADSRCKLLTLSRRNLRPMLRDFDTAMVRPVSAASPALKLLKSYIGIFGDDALTPELEQTAVSHVYDLVAIMLSAQVDVARMAEGGGQRAARLRSAKAYVMKHLRNERLSPAAVAANLGVTPRYIHMLFEGEGVSFGKFVVEQRLALAYRLFVDPRCAGLSISAIAFDTGFGDLSGFNRNFRRRFGCTPSDLRNAARRA